MTGLVARHLDSAATLRILEVGRGVGQGERRSFLGRTNWAYTGADLQAGPNVDSVIADPHRWPFGDTSFDALVVEGTLERVPFFWLAWKEIVRILRPGGVLFLVGAAPEETDCWRFADNGIRALAGLGALEILEMTSRSGVGAAEVAVFRKPPTAGAVNEVGAPAPTGVPPLPSPLVREPVYARRYGLTVAEWMLYHHEEIVFDRVSWMGFKTLKNPLDCWIYQEILWEVKPEVVVEIGSLVGGGTLFFCHMLDLLGGGKVVSVDRDRTYFRVKHRRLVEVTGDSADPGVRQRVAKLCRGQRTLIVHDADHTRAAVLGDLRSYADLVSPGSYFIVEDGVVDVFDPQATSRLGWDHPGPLAAVREFLREDDRFVIDSTRERYLITYNPCGFLKRVG